MPENEDIDKLIKEAESIMDENIDEEIELLTKNSWANVDSAKYKRAKVIFEKVISLDPNNKRAQDGLSACLEMIEPYVPVQYMVPTPDPEALKSIAIDVGKKPGEVDKPVPKMKPWEIRRSQRAFDRRGVQYTAKRFSEDTAEAKEKVLKMIDEAKNEMKSGKDPKEIYDVTLNKIKEFQKRLHQGWKGHGPEILDEAIRTLKEALGL